MKPEKLTIPLNRQESAARPAEGRLGTGLFWGVLISIPLWISIFGWIMGFGH